MKFFKIIQNGSVIDAGFSFMRWNEKYHQLYYCDINDAQFAQSRDGTVYRDFWLRAIPSDAIILGVIDASIQLINKVEYDDIMATLDGGESIDIPEEDEPIEPPAEYTEEQDEEDRPLTVSEMRQLIKQQQNTIELLTNCLMEMSEVIYK